MLLIFLASLGFAYPYATDSMAFLYGSRGDGSIFRADLKSATIQLEVSPARANAAPAIGLFAGSGNVFSLVFGDASSIHRQRLAPFGVLGTDEYYPQAIDSAVFIGTDPYVPYPSSFYVFQSRDSHHAVTRVDQNPLTATEIGSIDMPGYTTDFRDGAIDEINGYAYGLYHHASYGMIYLYRWPLIGGSYTSVLPSGSESRKLLQMAIDSSRDTAVFFDDDLGRFVRLRLSSSTWIDTSSFTTDTVTDLAIAKNGDLIWSNNQKIYRSHYRGAVGNVVLNVANVKSIALDERNIRPHFQDNWSPTISVPSGGIAKFAPAYGLVEDFDYDQFSCRIIGNSLKTKIVTSTCSLYVDAFGVAGNNTDSLLLLVGDTHGGSDTVKAVVNITPNSGLSFNFPTTANIKAYDDSIFVAKLTRSIDTKFFDVSIRSLNDAINIQPLVADTNCTTQKEKWIGQVIQPQVSGELSEITLSGGYNGPVMLRIYYGIGIDSMPSYQRYLRSSKVGFDHTYTIPDYFYLGSGSTYTIALFPQQDSIATYCKDEVQLVAGSGFLGESNPTNPGYSLRTRIKIGSYTDEFVNLSRKFDTLALGYVASNEWVGTTRNYRISVNDRNTFLTKDISINVSSGSASSFSARPDARVAMWTGYLSSSSASGPNVPDWSLEVSTTPRTYVFELLDSSSTLLSNLYLDPQGGLHVSTPENQYGTQSFRMQRCYAPNMTPCSNWDTVKVTVSRPPSLIAPTIDSLVVGTNYTFRMRTPDPDVGDHALLKLGVNQVAIAAIQSTGNITTTRNSVVQSFRAVRSGFLQMIQVKAGFSASRVPVSLYKLKDANWTSVNDTSEAQKIFDVQVVVKPSATPDIVNLVLPEAQIDSASYYGVIIGNPFYSPIPHPINISLTQSGVSFPGYSFTSNEGTLTPNTNEDLQMQVLLRSSFSGFSNVKTLAADTMEWNYTPSNQDAGNGKIFAFTVSDGTAQFAQIVTTNVVVPANTLTLSLPTSVRVAGNPYDRQKFYFSQWATGTLNANTQREVQFSNPSDTTIFDSRPMLDMDGSLSFGIKPSRYGTVKFQMRVCNTVLSQCSPWAQSSIVILNPPVFSPKLPPSIMAQKDTTMRWTVSDPDVGDLAKLAITTKTLRLGDQQVKISRTLRSKAVGQFFRTSTNGSLGEIRVFAKFNESYVQYMIGDSLKLGDTTSKKDEAILEGYAPVTPGTLMWHSIPVFGDSILKTGITYQFSVGYGQSVTDSVDWGIDTTNSYARGSMIQWEDEDSTTHDSTSGGGKYIHYPKNDLMFELYWKSAGPTWIMPTTSGSTSTTSGYRDVRFTPSQIDTGSHRLLFSVSDGLSGAGSIWDLQVTANAIIPIDTPKVEFAGIRTQTRGQAALIQSVDGNLSALNSAFSLQVTLQGPTKDTTFTMRTIKTVLAPLALGKYKVLWTYGNATKTYFSGRDSFMVDVPVFTPPRTQTWYMIGFGSESMPMSSLKPANYVYRWDDMRTDGIQLGAYVARSEIGQAQPGEGYWYYAESADSLNMPLLNLYPAPLKVSVYKGGMGWNMISNPWNWPIKLDTLHEYFVWNDSTGNYGEPASELNGFMAAWVNISDESSITLNPAPSFQNGSSSLAKRSLARYVSAQEWLVQVSLLSGKLSDTWNFFGVHGRSQPEPPLGLGEYISLAFANGKELLASDLRTSGSDSSWILQLQSNRTRTAELRFEGIANLLAQGKRALLVLQDGSLREIPETGTVNITLSKGSQQANLYLFDAKTTVRMKGGIRGLQVIQKGDHSLVSFDAPLALTGKSATFEWTSADGRVLAQQSVPSIQAGKNQFLFPVTAHASFVRVKAGREIASVATSK